MSDERTFTQAEVDNIVKERLAKEKTKFETALAEKEKGLAAREFQLTAKETLTAKGLSHDLLEALNTSSKEAFDRSLAILEEKLKTNQAQSGGSSTVTKVSTGGVHSEGGTTEDNDIRAAMGLQQRKKE